MSLSRRNVLAGSAGAAALGGLPYRSAKAQAANTIKIGVLNDMSGMYRDISGMSSVVCARAAVQEFAGRGFNIEVVSADHPISAAKRTRCTSIAVRPPAT
jgi:branched-chain amino acid transport system substrate-binding protein